MQYRKLGSSDMELSAIGLGTMTWGEQNTQQDAFAQMDLACSYGVNFFDAAELYPIPPRPETQGRTESIIGEWLHVRGSRDKVFIATKVTGRSDRNSGVGHIRHGARLDRKNIQQAINDSLRRLKTDYVDLYQVHWPERQTNFFGRLDYQHSEEDVIPIAETLRALAELVESGKVRYLGVSNESPWGVLEYLRLHWQQGLPRIVSIQNPYNLINRSFDIGLKEIALRENIPLLAYSPLAFGVLTGKYMGAARPEGARMTLYSRFQRYFNEQSDKAVERYVDIAKRHRLDCAQMALAWINQQAHVASNLVGATNLTQLKSNIESIHLKLPAEVLAEIDAVHKASPNPAP